MGVRYGVLPWESPLVWLGSSHWFAGSGSGKWFGSMGPSRWFVSLGLCGLLALAFCSLVTHFLSS